MKIKWEWKLNKKKEKSVEPLKQRQMTHWKLSLYLALCLFVGTDFVFGFFFGVINMNDRIQFVNEDKVEAKEMVKCLNHTFDQTDEQMSYELIFFFV